MGSVTVDAVVFKVYGDLAGLDAYVIGLYSPAATAFRLIVPNERGRALVQARYYLDEQAWQGLANNADTQNLAWPRTGVVDRNGTAVDPTTVPVLVTQAEYEMAVLIATNPAIVQAPSSGTNTKMLKTGPLMVEFFAPTLGINDTILPTVLQRLVGQYLGGGASASSGIVSGACGDSAFTDCDSYTRNGPLS